MRKSLLSLALLLGLAAAPTPAIAGPLCEPPPPPPPAECVDAFALCAGMGDSACGECEAAGLIEACAKCSGDPECDPAAAICPLVEDGCKAAGVEDCSAVVAACEALF